MTALELEWNKRIAEYVGNNRADFNLKYHESWDALMPVVQKIVRQGHILKLVPYVEAIRKALATARLERVYCAVDDFIQSHNQWA